MGTIVLGLKTVELGRDNTNIVFTFTFEYENEIKLGEVGNENENELTEYQRIQKRTNSIGNMSNTVGIRKTKQEHRPSKPNMPTSNYKFTILTSSNKILTST
jgi:hypothetical protein